MTCFAYARSHNLGAQDKRCLSVVVDTVGLMGYTDIDKKGGGD